MKFSAFLVYYLHFVFMGFLFLGKAFVPGGLIDVLLVVTVLLQVYYNVCPLTTLEESLFKKAQLPYTYKSWTKWIYAHYGKYGPLLTFMIMWNVSEISNLFFSYYLDYHYTNFFVEFVMEVISIIS